MPTQPSLARHRKSTLRIKLYSSDILKFTLKIQGIGNTNYEPLHQKVIHLHSNQSNTESCLFLTETSS